MPTIQLLIGVTIASVLLAVIVAGWLGRRLFDQGEPVDPLSHRLNTITDSASVAIVSLDRKGRFIFANEYSARHYGQAPVVGRMALDVIGDAAYAQIKPNFERALQGEASSLEIQIQRQSETPLSVNAIFAPRYDERGLVEGIVIISEDVSQRNEAEMRLRQSEEGLSFALQSARMGTWELNLADRTLSCSQEMLDLWGITRDEFQGHRVTMQSKVHPADRDKMNAAIDAAVEQGSIYEFEFRIVPRPGEERWIASRGRCTFDTDSDRPVRFSGVVYDVTDRKAQEMKNALLLKAVSAFSKAATPAEVLDICTTLCAETFGAKSAVLADGAEYAEVFRTGEPSFTPTRVLIPIRYQAEVTAVLCIGFDEQKYLSHDSQQAILAVGDLVGQALERSQLYEQTQRERDHYRTFFALSSSGSAEVDASTRQLVRINARFSEITGYAADEILGKDFLELIRISDRSAVEIEMTKLTQGLQRAWRSEAQLLKKDGTIGWGIFSGNVVRDAQGGPRLFLIATLDISDLKRAVRSRDQFLSIASHELRTPLTSLQLQIQLRMRDLQRGKTETLTAEKIAASLDEQAGYVQRISHLVDDILDVSRIAEGRIRLQHETFDLCEMVRDVLARFKVTADAAHIAVELNACQSVVGTWDRFRLEQVLLNLLTNALRYGNKGAVQVAVKRDQDHALLVVRDQGMGIKPEDQTRIFERYERAVSENEVSGLGLGLYIANEIVLAHGGEICLTSEVGRGSEFQVKLPSESGEDA